MVYYSQFNTTTDHAFNVYQAIRYCREHGVDKLVFEKGVYDFYPDKASEDVMYVSNHDIYGIYRIAFLLKGMKNFTIDGGGSKFMFHDCILPFVLKNSENIVLENFSLDYAAIPSIEAFVTRVEEDFFEMDVLGEETYRIDRGQLYAQDQFGLKDYPYASIYVRGMNYDRKYLPITRDAPTWGEVVQFEDLGNRKLRMYEKSVRLEQGTNLTLRCKTTRQTCNIVISECKDISVQNVVMHRSYGMGVLAQKTENVTIDRMTVEAREGHMDSLNADATHFVHCKGLVKVTNSSFREQLDDALNIHGIFTKIIEKTDTYILVKYMHSQAQGINIYDKGAVFQTLNPKTLIPNREYEIADVDVINMNITRIYVKGGTGNIRVGDVVEDLTWSCDLLFENNKVWDNRARGMLIASKGKTVIRNNYFNSPGVAILFESDGQFWFESGGTNDVEILGNTFENCKFATAWGKYVITVKPREEFNEGQFYHKFIRIAENRFVGNKAPLLYADNIAEVVFENNTVEDQASEELTTFVNCGIVRCDV